MRGDLTYIFSSKVLKGGDKWNEDLITFENYAKPDGTMAFWGEQIRDSLAAERGGMACDGSYDGLAGKVKWLSVSATDGGPYEELTFENVRTRKYPLDL